LGDLDALARSFARKIAACRVPRISNGFKVFTGVLLDRSNSNGLRQRESRR